jgi:hypothetical protein
MFAFSLKRPEIPVTLATKVRPLAAASSRLVPVAPPWAELLPEGGLRRGTTVVVDGAPGAGTLTLAYSLISGASAAGHWCAVVGVDDPGVVSMDEIGVDLRRVLFVPRPRGAWAETAADLIDGVDAVVLKTPSRTAHGAARRLSGRVRERGAVLIVLSEPAVPWPLPADLTVEIVASQWVAHSRLEGRESTVRVSGRGAARRPRECLLTLPSATGRVGAG